MKTYQKHEVTVKGSAIAITAEFILDVYKKFAIAEQAIDSHFCRGVIIATRDKDGISLEVKTGVYADDYDDAKRWTAMWELLYSILKTVDSDFKSETLEAYFSQHEDNDEDTECGLQAPTAPAAI